MINRLKLAPTYIAILCSVALIGCSSTSLHSPKENNLSAFTSSTKASQQLTATLPCCDSLATLTFQPLSEDNTQYIAFDEGSQAYDFETGKSFYQAYKLDDNISELKVTLSGLFYNTVFSPQVVLLDSQFNKTRTIAVDKFIYKEAKLLNGDELSASFSITRPNLNNPKNETYFVIYSTKQAMQAETTITHPAKLDARGRNVVEPDIADPIIKHSAMGVVKLDLTLSAKNDAYIAEEIPVSDKNMAENSLTEEQYNEKIINAVADGSIKLALQLVDQAEALGSKSARATFVAAIKK